MPCPSYASVKLRIHVKAMTTMNTVRKRLADFVAQQHLQLQPHVFANLSVAVQEFVFRHVLYSGVFHFVDLVINELDHQFAVDEPQCHDRCGYSDESKQASEDRYSSPRSMDQSNNGLSSGMNRPAAIIPYANIGQHHPPDAFVHQRAA